MSARVCVDIKIYCVLSFFFLFSCHHVRVCDADGVWRHADYSSMYLMVRTGWDIVKASYGHIWHVEAIKQKHLNKPSFEVGYVMFQVFEKYRKMVDKFTTCIKMDNLLHSMELVMYLEEVENQYWEVEHLTNMLHEIERKYNVSTPLNSTYRELTEAEKRKNPARYQQASTPLTSPDPTWAPRSPWPIDYGWEIYGWGIKWNKTKPYKKKWGRKG